MIVRAKHALTRGGSGVPPPPRKLLYFSSSEVVFEPVSANSIALTTPWNRPLYFHFLIEFSFGKLEFTRLVRMMVADISLSVDNVVV